MIRTNVASNNNYYIIKKIMIKNHTAYKSNYSIVKKIIENYDNRRLSMSFKSSPNCCVMLFEDVIVLTLYGITYSEYITLSDSDIIVLFISNLLNEKNNSSQ